MRVNVYAEEITSRIEIVTTKADTGATFVGLRFYLKTHEDMLPPRHPDDDSSAVTILKANNITEWSELTQQKMESVLTKVRVAKSRRVE